jgi:DNA polymerase III psi subunit
MTKSKPVVPVGLLAGGERVWSAIVEVYDLRPDELATLEDACRLTDMVDAMSAAWAGEGSPLTTKGSMGQLVTHPMISEIRAHRMARNALWRQLKLPDTPAEGSKGVPNQQREAAQSRWAAAHGRSS